MKKTCFDKLGEISMLGFGAMRLPQNNGVMDQEKTNEMVAYALENGINYFDTAHVYNDGDSERALAKALENIDRSSYYLADKMPLWEADSPEYLEKTFAESLERLNTDYIDFYLVHSVAKDLMDKVINLNVVDFIKQKKREGKIKHIGFSIHDDMDCLLEMLKLHDWEFVQIQYNYLDIDGEPGDAGYKELLKREIPIIIMEPLKGGILTDLPEIITQPYREFSGSNASFSFRWLCEKEGIACVLSGMSNMEQLKENIDIFNNVKPLSQQEHAAIAKVSENVKKHQKVPCTGCAYCMPCPVGINIPESFKAWNTKSLNKPSGNWIFGDQIDYDKAASCVECGACVSHCPQHIEIPQMLQKLVIENDA